MITVVKLVILLLLTGLFMGRNTSVNFVAALGTTASEKHEKHQQQWQQQRQQQPIPGGASSMPLTAPTSSGSETNTGNDFTTSTLPNGVGYSNSSDHGRSADDGVAGDEKLPSEVQKAVCTVTAGEVRASAEAVTTKTLKGVCGSAELKLALNDLEAKLYTELQQIKLLLQHITKHYGINVPNMENILHHPPATTFKYEPALAATPTRPPSIIFPDKSTISALPKLQPIVTPRQSVVPLAKDASHIESPETSIPHHHVPELKSLERQKPNALQQEVSRFNNTLLGDSDLRVFTYYWKLENFTERIDSAKSYSIESPTFSIKGKPLHLRANFQHLHRDFLYLQLELGNFKSSNSNNNNIVLEMGGLFKQILDDKVMFKHKISILNQYNQRSKDLISQEFHNLESGFQIPNSALIGSPYIKNNSLLIQIFLYL